MAAMSLLKNEKVNVFIRNSVRKVLGEQLSEKQARFALALWDAKYEGNQVSGLVQFIKEISNELGLDQQHKHQFRTALYRSLYSKGQADNPFQLQSTQPTRSGAPPSNEVRLRIVADSAAEPQEQEAALEISERLITDILPREKLVQSVNALYKALCAAIGPSSAAAILVMAINKSSPS